MEHIQWVQEFYSKKILHIKKKLYLCIQFYDKKGPYFGKGLFFTILKN